MQIHEKQNSVVIKEISAWMNRRFCIQFFLGLSKIDPNVTMLKCYFVKSFLFTACFINYCIVYMQKGLAR